MSQKRDATKVGIFVLLGVIAVAGLMLNFSRGVGLFKEKYTIQMRVRTVAGLQPNSTVFYSGIEIGNVESVQLDQHNTNVVVRLRILKKYPLHRDDRFVIEQIGVLGDQFVIVYPGSRNSPMLKDGDQVNGAEPFNIQELAKSTTDLLRRFDQLGATVGEAITRVNTQVLDAQTLSNLSRTIANFEQVSDRTLDVIDGVSILVTNNTPALGQSMSNLIAFSDRMQKLAGELDETVVANRSGLTTSLQNMQDATASLKKLSADVEAGRGLVGGLLKDENLRVQISTTASNLAVLSSNLNRYGLLYKPKPPKQNKNVYTGKSPFK